MAGLVTAITVNARGRGRSVPVPVQALTLTSELHPGPWTYLGAQCFSIKLPALNKDPALWGLRVPKIVLFTRLPHDYTGYLISPGLSLLVCKTEGSPITSGGYLED